MRILIEIDDQLMFSGEGRIAWAWLVRYKAGLACEECGSSERLHAHHIDRNAKNSTLANGECLCQSCHTKRHWREDPSYREKCVEAMSKHWSDPVLRASTIEAAKRGIQEKTTAESRSEARKRSWVTRRAKAGSCASS